MVECFRVRFCEVRFVSPDNQRVGALRREDVEVVHEGGVSAPLDARTSEQGRVFVMTAPHWLRRQS